MKRALRLGLVLFLLTASTAVFADGGSRPPLCMPGVNCTVR